MKNAVIIDGERLTIEDVVSVSREYAQVEIPKAVLDFLRTSRSTIEHFVEEEQVVYGITTGFGPLRDKRISKGDVETLQENLIKSHSVGFGDPLPTEAVRAMMLLRANALAKGYSGVRPDLVCTLAEMLNKKVHPIIPAKGSVGASGDLVPLSHMTLVVTGLGGEAEYKGKVMGGKSAMAAAGLAPVKLKAKEGLAMINGTQAMSAIGSLAVFDSLNISKVSDIAGALSFEALVGASGAMDRRIHEARPHPGQGACAHNIRRLTKGSKLVDSTKKVQDDYCLRCMPQVHGASRDAVGYAKGTMEIEINSATDNPLLFYGQNKRNMALSGGNFHGQPVSIAMDFLGMAVATFGNVSERRTFKLLTDKDLPFFLTRNSGLNSGLMIAQYTSAALASENKILAHPASVDTIPTSAGIEDHVSMGTIAARKAAEIVKNVEAILAIELMCAAQAADFRGPEKLGAGALAAYRTVRKHIRMLEDDRILHDDVKKIVGIINSGELVGSVESAVGMLK